MSRYKPNRVVHADWWDEGEHVTFKGTMGYLASQRASFHVAATRGTTPTTPEEVARFVEHMTAALLEMLDPDGFALALPDGSPVPLTPEGLADLPPEDVAFIFTAAFPADPDIVVTDAGTPAEEAVYQPEGLITSQAAEVGLNPSNFPTVAS